jgi:hypothetical protein
MNSMKRTKCTGLALPGAFLLAACLGAAASPAKTRQEPSGSLPEYVIKSGFLFNFAKYVDWPAEAFEKNDTPITIGIVGADPFGEELEKALRNKTVRDRSFSIQRYRETGDIKPCHILFIPRSEKARLPEILKHVGPWPVLTVGEEEGFARSGGAISILIEKEKPKLEVNPDAAEKARLTINSKLLRLATVVKTEK